MPSSTRVLIAGGPKTGKSTLAKELCAQMGCVYLRSERLLAYGVTWAELAAMCAEWLKRPGPWVIEGLTVPRIIRRWYNDNPGHPLPCDEIWWLGTTPRLALRPGQIAAAKAVTTVWNQCVPSIKMDGVAILCADGAAC